MPLNSSDPILEHTRTVQQLFVRYQPRIRGFILSLLPDPSDAEDLLQDVFLVVTDKAADYRLDSNFLAWVFAIARNKVLHALRQARRRGAALSEDVVAELLVTLPEEPADEERLAVLRGCLERLAPQARRIVQLRYQHEHKPKAIAGLTGWSANAVSVALARARTALRQCLEHQAGGQAI